MYKWDDKLLRKMWTVIDNELRNCRMSFEKSEPEEFRF